LKLKDNKAPIVNKRRSESPLEKGGSSSYLHSANLKI
jgi:hypothetical protein